MGLEGVFVYGCVHNSQPVHGAAVFVHLLTSLVVAIVVGLGGYVSP